MPEIAFQAGEKIVLLHQRREVQSELECGSLNANTRIGQAARHAQGHGNVGLLSQSVIPGQIAGI